jgi:peroxiredoxin (alkyl hydroperoxide reductase subunit C)
VSTSTVPDVGTQAPDFRLRGPGGQPIALSDYRGRRHVVLVFFPLAFSPVCSHQLPVIQRDLERLHELGAEVLGISVDSHFANEAFARHLGLTFPLLSDWRREASAAYGVLLPEAQTSTRAIFVVDRNGAIVHREAMEDPSRVPSNEAVLRALEGLRGD